MATITIDLTAKQAVRVQAAIKDALRLEEPATTNDARRYLIQQLKKLVVQYERNESVRVARAAALPFDLEP